LGGRNVTGQITTDIATGERRLVLTMAGGQGITNEDLAGLADALAEKYPDQGLEKVDEHTVSPYFSERFLRNAVIALVLSAVLIIVYVWFSFRKIHGLSAGVMSLIGLLHDVLVVFFTFIIFRIPIGDSFIAVALTVLGYSINDTIVIFDRIRENARLYKNELTLDQMVNKSVSQSFTRTLNTSLAVFASVFILYVFAFGNGLDSVSSFALPMTVGAASGLYSSVCLVSSLWTSWQMRKEKKAATPKVLDS